MLPNLGMHTSELLTHVAAQLVTGWFENYHLADHGGGVIFMGNVTIDVTAHVQGHVYAECKFLPDETMTTYEVQDVLLLVGGGGGRRCESA